MRGLRLHVYQAEILAAGNASYRLSRSVTAGDWPWRQRNDRCATCTITIGLPSRKRRVKSWRKSSAERMKIVRLEIGPAIGRLDGMNIYCIPRQRSPPKAFLEAVFVQAQLRPSATIVFASNSSPEKGAFFSSFGFEVPV